MNPKIAVALQENAEKLRKLDETSLKNQQKVIKAFSDNRIALRHFNGTSGYGYDDVGRDSLSKVLADVFSAESALVSPLIASGTHALSLALFGILRPGDVVLSITGEPYDTMQDIIHKKGIGSLIDFGVRFECLQLTAENEFNREAIKDYLLNNTVKMVYIQRSRGYSWRLALSIDQIGEICKYIKRITPNVIILCDNCYGEFVEDREPCEVGVDICAGSFIKNIGGGIAPTGGYVVGKSDLINDIAGRLTAPSIGAEVGSYACGYRLFYQGIFLAPHVVTQALKTALLFSAVLKNMGYEVLPKPNDQFGDIVCSVKLGSSDKMVKFCQAVQSVSPVDGFVTPEPWTQPGYSDKVIMAAGCFVQGASIELSCDGPIREPYIVYIQGGLTFEHGILALDKVLEKIS